MILTKNKQTEDYKQSLKLSLDAYFYSNGNSCSDGYQIIRGVKIGALVYKENGKIVGIPFKESGWYDILRQAKENKFLVDEHFVLDTW